MAFTVTNNSKTDVNIVEVGVHPARIVIIKPNGEKFEDFSVADPAPGEILPTVKPSQSKTWKLDISRLLVVTDRFKEPGIYRIYWTYFHRKSRDTVIAYKSNEVLVLREKGTPVIDPATGRPVPES